MKPASQMLAPHFETTAADVAEALGKIVEDEQKQRDSESEFKRAQAAAGKDDWISRPVMSEYCGLNEAEGIYFIAEVKNAGAKCKSFDQSKPARLACEDCTHQVLPEGTPKDAKIEQAYVNLAAKGIGAKVERDTTQQGLETFRKGTAARKALEVAGLYQTKGHHVTKPAYVATCAFYSTPDDFVVCLFQNPYNTCPSWQAKQEAPMSETTSAAPTPSVAPPQAGSATVLPPLIGVTDAAPATPVSGPAALTPEIVEQTCATLEWLLGVQLTPQARQLVEAGLGEEWSKQDQATTAGHMMLLQAHQNAVAGGPDNAEYVRELYQPEFVAGLRAQPDAASQALVQLYDAANPPLAPGNPPLTKEMADSYLGILSFVDALMENRAWAPMPEETKTIFAQQMASSYATLSSLQQQWLAALPLEWAKTRTLWQSMGEGDRTTLSSQLIGQLGAVAQSTPLLASMPSGPPVIGGAPAAGQAAGAGDKSIDDLLKEIADEQKKDEEEAAASSPELAAQVKLQNQLANASMLSNMMQMRHSAMMTIAQNIKA